MPIQSIIGLTIFIISAVFAFTKGKKFADKNFKKDKASRGNFLAFILFAPLVIITNLVDLPTAPGKPHVATFTQEGDLEFHEWGIWNPPWSDREIVDVPTYCHYIDYYSQNTRIFFKVNNSLYSSHFKAEVCIDNLKNFYKDKDSRKDGGYSIKRFGGEIMHYLYNAHISHSEDIMERLSGEKGKERASLLVEELVNKDIQKHGLIVKVSVSTYHIK